MIPLPMGLTVSHETVRPISFLFLVKQLDFQLKSLYSSIIIDFSV